MKERKKFKDIFEEDKNELLTLLLDVKIKGKLFNKNYSFTAKDELAGVNFHKYRYLDLAVEKGEDEIFEILGFYPAE